MKRLNVRRGFNRIYLVLSILWCLLVLWFPIQIQNDEISRYVTAASLDLTSCTHAGLKSLQQCDNEFAASMAAGKRNTAANPYLSFTGDSYVRLLLFPVYMIVLPLVVYGVLFGLSKLGMWIINGFESEIP